MVDDARQRRVEPGHIVALLDGVDNVQQVRVGAGQTLSELNQRAGEDIRPLYCDRYRNIRVGVGQEVSLNRVGGRVCGVCIVCVVSV